MFLIPTPQVLQKIITGLEDLYERLVHKQIRCINSFGLQEKIFDSFKIGQITPIHTKILQLLIQLTK